MYCGSATLQRHTHCRCKYPHDYHEATNDIECCPKWNDEWRANIGNLRPIERHREQSESRRDSELRLSAGISYRAKNTHQVCNNDVFRRKPRNDTEVTQSGEKQTRQKVKCDGAK